MLNADKYSVTTSGHQAMTSGIATIMISFRTMAAAGINYDEIDLIDNRQPRTDERKYKDKEGRLRTAYERRPGAALIQYDNRQFLSSMDGQSYFISELPVSCKTVDDAFGCLKPEGTKGKEGVNYLRQGEWFFIPAEKITKRKIEKDMPGRQFLPSRNMRPHHFATVYGHIDGSNKYCFVRGTVRHVNRDHKILKLGDGKSWFIALESNHVMSWGANGNID
jgi:hypothetical protein